MTAVFLSVTAKQKKAMRQVSAITARRSAGPAAALKAAAKFITSVYRLNRQAILAAATAANFACCVLLDATGDIRYWYGIIAAVATAVAALAKMSNK